MRLSTDYAQYYDEIFDDSGPVFHRMAFGRGGLTKRQQFELFRSLGLSTPPHGALRALSDQLQGRDGAFAAPPAILSEMRCVVYLDEQAHAGQGKVLMSLPEAMESHPNHFASVFVSREGPPVAFRLARFGSLQFWLRQTGSRSGWRSNWREAEQVLEKRVTDAPNPIRRVLWAIDFIPSSHGLLAVDFNTAPDLATLGETHALSASEAHRELAAAASAEPASLSQF